MITTQAFTKSQEGIENELGGDFLVYLSVLEEDQPGCSHAISHHCSVYLKKLSSSTPQHRPTLQRLPPISQSIHPSILDILFLRHLLRTFPITLISSPHSPPASWHCLSDGPAAGMLTCHQPPAGRYMPQTKRHWDRACQKVRKDIP